MDPDATARGPEPESKCAECGIVLGAGQDRETTEGGTFCRPCFHNLTAQLERLAEAQRTDVNYTLATVGGLVGGAVGIVVWWGFTVLTEIAFGLVAVVIGLTVGKGVTILSGHKRSQGLQILSVAISGVSFLYASYLVHRTFLLRAAAEEGADFVLPWVPSPALLFQVVRLGFNVMDLVFLAIVLYQAWKIPAPFGFAPSKT